MRWVLAWDSEGHAGPGWASHVMLRWNEFEPSKGKYNFGLVEKALSAADRSCYLQIGFSMYDKVKKAPVDYTPNAHARRISLTAASGVTGYTPDYTPTWTEAYKAAIGALAGRFRDDPRVAGYWHAAGWAQETQAAVNNGGGAWADLLKPKLAAETYFASLRASTRHAIDAWGPAGDSAGKPVYLPGAPGPGSVWGSRRRDVVAELLEAGAGYMNCALLTDNDTAWGIGGHAGLGISDIVIGRTARIGFEEGPRKAAQDAGELYWMALRARHWLADYLCVYASISAAQVAPVESRLPKAGWRWIVFRDREYPETAYKGADGRLWGHAGEPGDWGDGLTVVTEGVTRVFDKTRFDEGRWRLRAAGGLELAAPGLADGAYPARVYYPDGGTQMVTAQVAGGKLGLPPAATGLTTEYHRVDVDPTPQKPVEVRDPLPEDEPVATAEKARWWAEECKRQLEAGNDARAQAILDSLIAYLYRVEGVK